MEILKKEVLTDYQGTRIVQLDIHAPLIAAKALPGQFVVLMLKEEGERIPLTIVDADQEKETVTIIAQEAGLTTRLLGRVNEKDSLYSIVGPLGHATEIKKYGEIVLVGGGVGIAEIYPVAKAFKEAGNIVITILGARTKELLVLENELRQASTEFYVMTDDGSYGKKGFTTDMLKDVLRNKKRDLVYAVGPIPMMRRVAAVAKEFNARAIVSLNALMVDGTGMCGCCRVTVGGKTRFSCVDGPEFEADLVDWDELVKRNNIYTDKEKHICRLNNLL